MKAVPLIIWGAGGHAKVLLEFVDQLGLRAIALFDNSPASPSTLEGIPVHIGEKGFKMWLDNAPTNNLHGLVAIGGSLGRDRLKIQRFLADSGIVIPRVVHPSAFVARNAKIDEGTQVLAKAAVGANTEVGAGAIINTSASIDHECQIGAGVHVGPGATLAGCVQVGQCALIAVGAVVMPRVKIGDDAIVGAGAVVTKDVGAGDVVVGNPARFIRRSL